MFEELVETFLIESEEFLEEMESDLLKLQDNLSDETTINSLFRCVHTLKGSAGIIGLKRIEHFTHWVENVMEKVRLKEIEVDDQLCNILLESRDHLLKLTQGLSESGEEPAKDPSDNTEDILINKFKRYLEDEQALSDEETPPLESSSDSDDDFSFWHIQVEFAESTFLDGFDPASFIAYLDKLGQTITIKSSFNRLPSLEDFDPEHCYLTVNLLLKSSAEKQTIEDAFEFIKDDSKISIIPVGGTERKLVDKIQRIEHIPVPEDAGSRLGDILIKSGAATEGEIQAALSKQEQTLATSKTSLPLGKILSKEHHVPSEVIDAAIEHQKPIKSKQLQKKNTLRIDAEKLDQLIDLVGELVTLGAGFNQIADRLQDEKALEASTVMNRLTEELRERTMSIRMVSVEPTFKRFQRVIHDISQSSGKAIRLEISGAEAELDKTVIEKIVDPLKHLVRNAADHGIESPEERKVAAKPAEGIIRLKAYHDAGSIVIEVSDDGKGIPIDKIRNKAIEKGILSVDQKLSDQEIRNLIFAPGFSTAAEVTNISGRGVGMDVVRSNIEALRGTVEIQSEEGKGSVFRIRLPLTLAIIDGLLVKVGSESYVIPLDMVEECIDLPNENENESSQYINLRNEVLPYFWLRRLFQGDKSNANDTDIVVVRFGNESAGIVVEELIGEIQAVIKSLDEVYQNVPGISGATILGDGNIALILDIPHLIKQAEKLARTSSVMEEDNTDVVISSEA